MTLPPFAGWVHWDGVLVQDHEVGGEITDNLDPLADAVAVIESHGGTADLIVTSPIGWASVSKLKTDAGSNLMRVCWGRLLSPQPASCCRSRWRCPRAWVTP
jgi:hypothetical protein